MRKMDKETAIKDLGPYFEPGILDNVAVGLGTEKRGRAG